jgi:hypothetical protein
MGGRQNINVQYRFEILGEVLRAELYRRETGDEARQFIDALAAKARECRLARILVAVRASRPIFKVEQYGISEAFRAMAGNPALCVALTGDTEGLRASHEYIEVLARQQKVNLRSFRDDAAALQWLSSEVVKSP